jgi:2,4-dienoyl-CoA reductase-like NADH-dependent reductase (Old Yellow Enzyme family)
MKYTKLFEPAKIGTMTLKNRIVMTPMGVSLPETNGQAGDNVTAYLEERAKGGVGMIIPGIVVVDSETGRSGPHEFVLESKFQAFSIQRMIAALHKYDTKVTLQLYHPGKETHSRWIGGKAPVSASEMKTRQGEMTRALTTEEVEAMAKKYVNAAVLAKEAGADAVEVHAAHGYLVGQFLTPLFNKRTDKYGGSFEGRMQFVTEIINGIRAAVGPSYPVGVRMSADEYIEGGNTLEDGVKMAKWYENLGVDFLDISCSLQESAHFNREPPSFQQGWKRHNAATIKQNVKIPVIAVNTIKKPEFAESLLEDGVSDFAALSRQHLAEPEWTKKVKEGREDELRTCISCLHCIETMVKGGQTRCTVNARAGREREFDYALLDKSGDGKHVVVIGGGPGGLEAARILAMRNFKVTLFEKSEELGGQLNYAEKPPMKEKITWLKQGMIAQVKNAGVSIKLGTEATVDAVKKLKPVGVFICCGSVPIRPASIQGISGAKVTTVPEVLTGAVDLDGKKVVIVGSGLAGLETAAFLGSRGCKVSVIEMKPTIGEGIFAQVLADTLKELEPYGVKLFPGHTLKASTTRASSRQSKAAKPPSKLRRSCLRWA